MSADTPADRPVRYVSAYWLARVDPARAEDLSLDAWLKLPEKHEHAAVEGYLARTACRRSAVSGGPVTKNRTERTNP